MPKEWYAQGVMTDSGVLWQVQINTSEHSGNMIDALFSFKEAEAVLITLNYNGTKPKGLKIKKSVKFQV